MVCTMTVVVADDSIDVGLVRDHWLGVTRGRAARRRRC